MRSDIAKANKMARHWKTNEIVNFDQFVDVPEHRHQTARFHRAHLHQALLEHVPRDLIHLKKKAVRAEADHNAATVFFEDGTSASGDILVGADGIKSVSKTQGCSLRNLPSCTLVRILLDFRVTVHD